VVPGWKVEVDNVPQPILRTDVLFRGVEIPAGGAQGRVHLSTAIDREPLGSGADIVQSVGLAANRVLTSRTFTNAASFRNRRVQKNRVILRLAGDLVGASITYRRTSYIMVVDNRSQSTCDLRRRQPANACNE
jgi:hypothetical protein